MNERLQVYEDKMTETMANLDGELGTIRAGRANPHVLDKIMVDYYGTPTPIQQVANVSVPEPRMIQIQPWEKSMVKVIEKAIMVSELGINPTNDGSAIRLIFPELTEERRKELVKDVKKKERQQKLQSVISVVMETMHLKIEGIRGFRGRNQRSGRTLQKVTDKYIKEVDKAVDAKSKEVMTV